MPKLMLIEDDAMMLSLLRTLLQIEGYDVAHLSNGEDIENILTILRQEKPALILLDVHFRQINGFDLLRSIRHDQELKGTHVLMSSGMDVSARSQIEGADDFLLKPYMPDELIKKIQRTLGN